MAEGWLKQRGTFCKDPNKCYFHKPLDRLETGPDTGVTYLYLGSMALLLPYYAGSWGVIGGVMGPVAGLGYITATLVEVRKSRQATPSTTPEMGSTSS